MRALVITVAAAVAIGPLACERTRSTPTIKPVPEPDAAGPLRVPGPLSPRLASYRIDARLDARQRHIAATERLSWRNAGASPVQALCLHLYMNAFRDDESLFMISSGGVHRRGVADPSAPGWIDVTSIRVGDVELSDEAAFEGPDQTLMMVPLPAPVEPGGDIAVDLEFEVQLPRVFARTGYEGDFIMVGQWFPKVGVRVGPPGQERWACRPFHVFNEFFADFGTYDVALTVPDTHVVAATGVLTAAEDNGDGTRTLRYRAEDVHDFAWMADPFMEVLRGTATVAGDPVEVRVYHRPAQRAFAERHLRAAVGAVELFSELLFPYPYSLLSVIDPPPDAQAGAGGMEYPTLVTTSGEGVLADAGIRLPELVTIHEVAHNWLQGIIATNEVQAAWLDEGVDEYLTDLAMRRLYGDDAAYASLDVRRASLSGRPPLVMPPATPSYEFPDYDAYATAVYDWTALAMATLAGVVGEDQLLAALGDYARRWAFRHPTADDFVDALEGALGRDLDWYFDAVIRDTGAPAFSVRSLWCTADDGRCEVLVANTGDVAVPVDVVIRFDDGEVLRERWDDGSMYRRFRYERGALVDQVWIDPAGDVLINQTPLASARRRRPEREAARQAAGRAAFWTQTAMQVLGL